MNDSIERVELNELNKSIDKIYSERKDFIIIGLTGRTGVGCSTSSQLLNTDFRDLDISKQFQERDNNARKSKIINNFVENNWNKFEIIEAKTVITSFIIEENYDTFVTFVGTEIHKVNGIENENIIEQLLNNENFSSEFNSIHELRCEIKERFETNIVDQTKYFVEEDVYSFYFDLLPKFTSKIKEVLFEINKDLYYKVFQKLGQNIRKSGNAYENIFVADRMYIFPQRINKFIKILRSRNLLEKTGVRVVIDSLKNPHEISFFKDRYSSFYTFAIHCDDKVREHRLFELGFKKTDINAIDTTEYPLKPTLEKSLYMQSIPDCIEQADIHIDNSTNTKRALTNALIKYVALIMHPGLVTPTHQERVMNMAFSAKMNSTCISRKVGAAISDEDFSLLSLGWNSPPSGQVGCNLRVLNDLVQKSNPSDFSKFENEDKDFLEKAKTELTKLHKGHMKGRPLNYCFKDIHEKKNQVHTRALHAEENAFLQLIKSGIVNRAGNKLFTTSSPCVLCSKKAYHLGIDEVYFIEQYPDISEFHIFNQGSTGPKLRRFQGAIGNAYFKLFQPIMSYKDELELLTR